MENKKQLPAVLKMRAERILQKAIKAIYKTTNPSVAECVLLDNSVVHVDLDNRKRITPVAVDTSKAGDGVEKPAGNFHSAIKRPAVETAPDYVSSETEGKETIPAKPKTPATDKLKSKQTKKVK